MTARTHDETGAAIYMDHPAEPLRKPMTDLQAELLDRICRTNGGGVSIHDTNKSALTGLMKRHFVQGKQNGPTKVVHTREGLAEWRSRRIAKEYIAAGVTRDHCAGWEG